MSCKTLLILLDFEFLNIKINIHRSILKCLITTRSFNRKRDPTLLHSNHSMTMSTAARMESNLVLILIAFHYKRRHFLVEHIIVHLSGQCLVLLLQRSVLSMESGELLGKMVSSAITSYRSRKFYHESPLDYDVLCGQDRAFAEHCGNIIYWEIVHESKRKYHECKKKDEKYCFAEMVVSRMKLMYGTRFFCLSNPIDDKRNKTNLSNPSFQWEELTDSAAIANVLQSFDYLCGEEIRSGLAICHEEPGRPKTNKVPCKRKRMTTATIEKLNSMKRQMKHRISIEKQIKQSVLISARYATQESDDFCSLDDATCTKNTCNVSAESPVSDGKVFIIDSPSECNNSILRVLSDHDYGNLSQKTECIESSDDYDPIPFYQATEDVESSDIEDT
jgi:hypothetical protein